LPLFQFRCRFSSGYRGPFRGRLVFTVVGGLRKCICHLTIVVCDEAEGISEAFLH
jgi:CRISPR/Cas system-associated protein Cas5 (RAMP superfamily)